MKNKREASPKQRNSALESFRHDRSKNFMRNRFFASVIDLIIIMILCWLAFALFGVPDWGRYLMTQDAVRGLAASEPLVVERMKLYQECFLITLAIGAAYDALTTVLFKATAGKLLFGMRIVNSKDSRNFYIGKLMLVLRSALKAASIYLLAALPFIFMCLTALGNAEGRSGFDMFAGTKVISTRSD